MLTKLYAATLYSKAHSAYPSLRAEKLLLQCLKNDSTYMPAWFLLLRAAMQRKDYAESIRLYDQLTAVSPQDNHFLITSGNMETWLELAYWSLLEKKPGTARAMYALLLEQSATPTRQQYRSSQVAAIKAAEGLVACEAGYDLDLLKNSSALSPVRVEILSGLPQKIIF